MASEAQRVGRSRVTGLRPRDRWWLPPLFYLLCLLPRLAAGQSEVAPAASAASVVNRTAAAPDVTAPAPAVRQESDVEVPPAPPMPPSPPLQVAWNARPLWSGYDNFGALWMEGGALYRTRSGFLFGGQALFFLGFKFGGIFGVPVPMDFNIAIRPRLGYGRDGWAVAIAGLLSLSFRPQIGGYGRVGRLDRIHAELWAQWIIDTPFPGDVGFRFVLPLRDGLRLFATAGLDSLLTQIDSGISRFYDATLYQPRLYALLGALIEVGSARGLHQFLNLGVGVTHVFSPRHPASGHDPLPPGPVLQIGYELWR